jgi:hypothetical protein
VNVFDVIVAPFVSGLTIDVLGTLVFHYTNKNRAVAAASVNTLLQGLWVFVFVDVSDDHIRAIPYLLGIWIGGLIGIAFKKKLEYHSVTPVRANP